MTFRTLYLSLFAIIFCSTAHAKNCTKTEKRSANQFLIDIQDSQEIKTSLLQYHMPFSFHKSSLDSTNEVMMYQNGFLAMHDPDLRTSLWTAHKLTKTDIEGAQGKKRTNCFRSDPRLSKNDTGIASDYNEAIFDQGHLTSDSDVKDRFIEQLNTYTFVNISPQYCYFNRGIWLNLEHLTRKLALLNNELYVTSGAIFDRDSNQGRDSDSTAERMLSRNGKSRVAIPSHFYKVLMKRENDRWSSLAFLLPHDNNDHGHTWDKAKPYAIERIVSLEEIEAKASLELFPNILRRNISQNGGDWDLSKAGNGMTGRCKSFAN